MSLREIEVDKAALITTLKENRARHQETFLLARKEYREIITEQLELKLKDAQDGKAWEPFVLRDLGVKQPEDHTEQYDQIIGMLEMALETTVVINQTEYQQYVMDKWDFHNANVTAMDSYRAAKMSAAYRR